MANGWSILSLGTTALISIAELSSSHQMQDMKAKILKRKRVYRMAQERSPSPWKNQVRDWNPIEKVYLNPTREEKLKKIA